MPDLFATLEPDQPPPAPAPDAPLADRLRPHRLEEVVGQEHLTGAGGAIGRMVAAGKLSSMILWGPPGTGKTTIARLLADAVGLRFASISAVFSGVADLKRVFAEARDHARTGKRTLLFVDEIPPLQPRAAGRLPAVRRGRHGGAGRRDDREPVVRAQRRAAQPRAGAGAPPARSSRAGDPARPCRGGGRPRAAGHARRARRAAGAGRWRRAFPAQSGGDAVRGRPARPA